MNIDIAKLIELTLNLTLKEAESLAHTLTALHSAPVRQYHNVYHAYDVVQRIIGVLPMLDPPYLGSGLFIFRAAWFHDAVYYVGAQDNEERSADVATAFFPYDGTGFVHRLVLATKDSWDATKQDTKDPLHEWCCILRDCDRSGLAAEYSRFHANGMLIQHEYINAGVQLADFTKGRVAWFNKTLAAPFIFHNNTLRSMWEHRARANIETWLASNDAKVQ